MTLDKSQLAFDSIRHLSLAPPALSEWADQRSNPSLTELQPLINSLARIVAARKHLSQERQRLLGILAHYSSNNDVEAQGEKGTFVETLEMLANSTSTMAMDDLAIQLWFSLNAKYSRDAWKSFLTHGINQATAMKLESLWETFVFREVSALTTGTKSIEQTLLLQILSNTQPRWSGESLKAVGVKTSALVYLIALDKIRQLGAHAQTTDHLCGLWLLLQRLEVDTEATDSKRFAEWAAPLHARAVSYSRQMCTKYLSGLHSKYINALTGKQMYLRLHLTSRSLSINAADCQDELNLSARATFAVLSAANSAEWTTEVFGNQMQQIEQCIVKNMNDIRVQFQAVRRLQSSQGSNSSHTEGTVQEQILLDLSLVIQTYERLGGELLASNLRPGLDEMLGSLGRLQARVRVQ